MSLNLRFVILGSLVLVAGCAQKQPNPEGFVVYPVGSPNQTDLTPQDLPFPANQINAGMQHQEVLRLLDGIYERSFNQRNIDSGYWCEGYKVEEPDRTNYLQLNFSKGILTRAKVVNSDACVIY